MNLIQLEKRSARRLELDSKPIQDFFHITFEIETLWNKIEDWTLYQGLHEFEPQKKIVAKLIELLGVKQNYNVKYENRNAVWCFQWDNDENNKFVIYQSVSGLSLKLYKDFNKEMIVSFLSELKELLLGEELNSDSIAN